MTDDIAKIRNIMATTKTCVVMPTYNNAKTIVGMICRVKIFSPYVIVVNDGSTDETGNLLSTFRTEVIIISYEKNKGKGYALKQGLIKAKERGFENAITIDTDGQHQPEEIPRFVEAMLNNRECIIMGSRNIEADGMSRGSIFANHFSNFWFFVQTSIRLPDTQTGYRLYPLEKLKGLTVLTHRYEAELELLVLAAWHGVRIVPISVSVYYPPTDERISHFRPIRDFMRIFVLNTFLCMGALVYGMPLRLHRYLKTMIS